MKRAKHKKNDRIAGRLVRYFLLGLAVGVGLLSPFLYQARQDARQVAAAYERLYDYWNATPGLPRLHHGRHGHR